MTADYITRTRTTNARPGLERAPRLKDRDSPGRQLDPSRCAEWELVGRWTVLRLKVSGEVGSGTRNVEPAVSDDHDVA